MSELSELEQALLFFSNTLVNLPDNSNSKTLVGMTITLDQIESMSIEDKRKLVDRAMKTAKDFRREYNQIIINED